MDFKSLSNKNNDTSKLIMTQPTMMFFDLEGARKIYYKSHVVKEDEIVRPDLIALECYNDESYLDIILKFNGISDPFSIMPGETILIPIQSIKYYTLDRPVNYEDNPIKNQFIDTKRLSKKDSRRLDALKKKYNKENLLPPNVIPVGKKNFEYDGGMIRFGAQVQTDAVVDSILKEISDDPNKYGNRTENVPVDDSFAEVNTSDDLSDKELEDALNNNNDKRGKTEADKTKSDKADGVGGKQGDGTAPKGTDNLDDLTTEGPCSK
tara:strand:- start:36529 stop:37323 length:795 start_codon:yes stop_codon:yes gene_type:complete